MKIFKIIPKRRWALALANRSIFQPKEATNCCLLPLPSNVHHNQRPSSASACSGCRVLTRHTHRHGGYCTPTANSNQLLHLLLLPLQLASCDLHGATFGIARLQRWQQVIFHHQHQRHMGTASAQTRRLTEAAAEAEAVPVPRSRNRLATRFFCIFKGPQAFV